MSDIAVGVRLKFSEKENIFEQAVEELNQNNELHPNIQLYRLMRDSSYEDMRAAFFTDLSNSHQSKFLKICLDNYDGIQKLKKFAPILDFTTSLLPMFNHLI